VDCDRETKRGYENQQAFTWKQFITHLIADNFYHQKSKNKSTEQTRDETRHSFLAPAWRKDS
jgi:hypothetical protein